VVAAEIASHDWRRIVHFNVTGLRLLEDPDDLLLAAPGLLHASS
jgi:hypothetical protein